MTASVLTDPNVAAWNNNSTGDSSNQGISTDGGATWFAPSGQTPGAYEVDGNAIGAVPEPGSLVLLTGGTALLGLARKLRRR